MPTPDSHPQGNDFLLRETLDALNTASKALFELTAEIKAERASRDADRAAMDRSRECMDKVLAVFQDREKREDESRKAENERRKSTVGMVKATGSYIGGIVKTPLGTLLIALAGYLAATWLNAPQALPAEPASPSGEVSGIENSTDMGE